MRNSFDHSLSLLSPALAGSILDGEKRLSAAAKSSFESLKALRKPLRDSLVNAGLIGSVSSENNTPLPPFSGIAGTYFHRRSLDSGVLCAGAFVSCDPGATPAGTAIGEDSHIFIESGLITGDTTLLLSALKAMMIANLSARRQDMVLVRGSFARLFASLMTALPAALKARETAVGNAILSGLKEAVVAFDTVTHPGEALTAGLTASGMDDFGDVAGFPPGIDGVPVLSAVLEPGEYAGPFRPNSRTLETVAAIPIKDQAFAGLRDRIIDGLTSGMIYYYRPRQWIPALRIELPARCEPDRLALLFATLDSQCSTAGYSEPFRLAQAMLIAGSFATAVETAHFRAVMEAAARTGDNLDTIPPLTFLGGTITGDDNGT